MSNETGNKRLVLCLDGTWNKQDDNTNVIHLHNLIKEGVAKDGKDQKKYYDLGVGTGVLDGISGGAFGFGLEENVREAMNWLIANYDDGDEIFIFGFSRGSYTARSLVGFIAKCGIPRRGAPLTVNQLWQGYCILGRQDEHRLNWWEELVGLRKPPFRSIEKYKKDDWRADLPPDDWRRNYPGPHLTPDELNTPEKLILKWCRRPAITCLGIFDTVGSMGAEALAIPGLRGELAAHHNMRLHSIVGHALHATAADENRTTFSLTPLSEFVPADKDSKYPDQAIKQCWFVGAHSNIGGGYEDNTLAQVPLKWMMDHCAKLGLEFLPEEEGGALATSVSPPLLPSLRDSYAEFASPLWTHVLRGKRNYRTIVPEAESFGPSGTATKGYSMRDPGSEVHESVLKIVNSPEAEEQQYAPANLLEYVRRLPDTEARRSALPALEKRCRHLWVASPLPSNLWLIFWAFTAAAGLTCVPHIFAQVWSNQQIARLACLTAMAAVIVDWMESWMVHRLALSPQNGYKRACVDVLYWSRAVMVVLFVIGFPYVLWSLLCLIWKHDLSAWLSANVWHHGPWHIIKSVLGACCFVVRHPWASEGFWCHWQPILLSAGVPALLLRMLPAGKPPAKVEKIEKSAVAIGVMVVAVLLGFVVLQAAVRLLWNASVLPEWPSLAPSGLGAKSPLQFAGGLLLVEIAFFGFLHSYHNWVGEPLARRHLRSIFFLQTCFRPSSVQKQLSEWATALLRNVLHAPGNPDELLVGESLPPGSDLGERRALAAVQRMKQTLCEALWRDTLGFVPLYAFVIGLGLWFAGAHLECKAFVCRHYVLFPFLLALADWGENAIHGLVYRRFFERSVRFVPEKDGKGKVEGGEPSVSWVITACTCTWLKMTAFAIGIAITFWGMIRGGWIVLHDEDSGWRGALALVCWAVLLVGALVQGIIFVKWISGLFKHRNGSPLDPSSASQNPA